MDNSQNKPEAPSMPEFESNESEGDEIGADGGRVPTRPTPVSRQVSQIVLVPSKSLTLVGTKSTR